MFRKNIQTRFTNSFRRVRTFVGTRHLTSIDAPIDKYYNTYLHLAVKRGNEERVLDLLRRGADVNATNLENATPLHMAIEYGHPHLIQFLVNHGADIEVERDDGFRPIHLLRDSPKKLECLEQLVKCGADINAKDVTGNTILHLVVKSDLEEFKLFKELLRYGANVNNVDFMNNNCLHTTAMRVSPNYFETKMLAEGLIAEGIDVNAKDIMDETPLHKATAADNANLVYILLRNGAKLDSVNYKNLTPFEVAVEDRNDSSLLVMLKHVLINTHRDKTMIEKGVMRKIHTNLDLLFWYQKLDNELNALKQRKLFECTIYDILCGEDDKISNMVKDKDSFLVFSNPCVGCSVFNREIVYSWNRAKKISRGNNRIE